MWAANSGRLIIVHRKLFWAGNPLGRAPNVSLSPGGGTVAKNSQGTASSGGLSRRGLGAIAVVATPPHASA
jgi:hypothetical protein